MFSLVKTFVSSNWQGDPELRNYYTTTSGLEMEPVYSKRSR